MRLVVTGGNGFIGSTMRLRLRELGHANVTSLVRSSTDRQWDDALVDADVVFHLAGVNRPSHPAEFAAGNTDLTRRICDALAAAKRGATLVLASSTQAVRMTPYGESKLGAEKAVREYGTSTGARACILRLPNVFGKWARPNYNSAVATFCYNTAHDLPITIHDAAAPLELVYIDDVIDTMLSVLPPSTVTGDVDVAPAYHATVGEIADIVTGFRAIRATGNMPRVGTGLLRGLYATYLSCLPPSAFSYPLVRHDDHRGSFAEMLRTQDSGQISCFTAHPGITRGEHYHHTKNEKFLVVSGRARFSFRQVLTGARHDIEVDSRSPEVVETVPGWAHNITNIGESDMIVLLWANEAFDPAQPDTIASRVLE